MHRRRLEDENEKKIVIQTKRKIYGLNFFAGNIKNTNKISTNSLWIVRIYPIINQHQQPRQQPQQQQQQPQHTVPRVKGMCQQPLQPQDTVPRVKGMYQQPLQPQDTVPRVKGMYQQPLQPQDTVPRIKGIYQQPLQQPQHTVPRVKGMRLSYEQLLEDINPFHSPTGNHV